MISEKTDVSDINIGANASAEEAPEQAEDSSEKSGCNIVLANRLQPITSVDKAAYQKHIKV